MKLLLIVLCLFYFGTWDSRALFADFDDDAPALWI